MYIALYYIHITYPYSTAMTLHDIYAGVWSKRYKR